ncbi:MAG: lycopene cyclase domain-containing protein [Aggregatilineales bacterium]
MTYSLFLLVFVCPPLGILLYVLRQKLTRPVWVGLFALVVVAVAYTTPWDNYLVASRVWYYDPRLVLNIILGYVPVEEYLFFILQTLAVGLFVVWLWRRLYPQDWTPPGRASRGKK